MSDSVLENTNEYAWWSNTVSQMGLEVPLTLLSSATVQHTIDTMKSKNMTHVPVLNNDG